MVELRAKNEELDMARKPIQHSHPGVHPREENTGPCTAQAPDPKGGRAGGGKTADVGSQWETDEDAGSVAFWPVGVGLDGPDVWLRRGCGSAQRCRSEQRVPPGIRSQAGSSSQPSTSRQRV